MKVKLSDYFKKSDLDKKWPERLTAVMAVIGILISAYGLYLTRASLTLTKDSLDETIKQRELNQKQFEFNIEESNREKVLRREQEIEDKKVTLWNRLKRQLINS